MRYLYQKFPHHNEQLSDEAETALNQGKTWLNIIPLLPALRSVIGSEKEMSKEKQDSHNMKGKRKETREDVNNNKADLNPSGRIWLSVETLFKGLNKWFKGGRVRARGPVSGQMIMTKLNQNILFGLATPQLPIWATDELPSTSKQPRAARALEADKWAGRNLPPHLPTTTSTSQTKNTNIQGKSVHERSPNDEGDRNEESQDHQHPNPVPSYKSSSDSEFSSKRDHRCGGGPLSIPGDEGGNDSDAKSSSDTPGGQGKKESKASIPYGMIRPTIKEELKQEQLPRWDGNPNTAVKYFLRIQQLAALEGDLPQALGYWLWMNLEDGSDIKDWFPMLTYKEQAHMRSHYINYLRGIKDGYLGEAWQSKINRVYETQYFHQVRHEKEQLKEFIIWRIMYMHMLTSAKPGSLLEINLIMR